MHERKTLLSRRHSLAGLLGLLLCPTLSWASPSADPLKVVTTIPDLADIVREIGGERVEVKSLSRGTENLHAVPVKPSMLIALSKADVFFEMGLSMESAWIPELLIAARNDDIAVGRPGFVNCGEGWEPIEVPDQLSRREGDIHPEGNPHYNLDPRAGRHLADRVLEGLARNDPKHRAGYERRHAAYLEKLAEAEARWKGYRDRLAGKKIAVYHIEYNYLALYHGMQVSVSIEPKPGIPPAPSDVARAIREIRDAEVPVIVTAAWSNNRQVSSVAKTTGARLVELPNQVGGAKWATSWIALMDGIHERLAKAFAEERE
jgi:zinc/manganese transport system substrate-binding protein